MFFAAEIMAVGWALAATDIVSRWFGTPSAWLDIAAAAAIIGSVAAYHRLRTALVAVEATSDAWRSERDAAVARIDRLVVEIAASERVVSQMALEIEALKLRPDLSRLEQSVIDGNAAQAKSADKMHGVLLAIAASLMPERK
jgi:hypothetical protein